MQCIKFTHDTIRGKLLDLPQRFTYLPPCSPQDVSKWDDWHNRWKIRRISDLAFILHWAAGCESNCLWLVCLGSILLSCHICVSGRARGMVRTMHSDDISCLSWFSKHELKEYQQSGDSVKLQTKRGESPQISLTRQG